MQCELHAAYTSNICYGCLYIYVLYILFNNCCVVLRIDFDPFVVMNANYGYLSFFMPHYPHPTIWILKYLT